MKAKMIIRSAAVILAALTLLCSCGSDYQTSGKVQYAPGADFDPTSVRMADGVTPEMATASHWKGSDADAIIMSKSEIETFNRDLLSVYSAKGIMYDLREFPSSYSGDRVRAMIEDHGQPGESRYINGSPVTAGYVEGLESACAVDSVPDSVSVGWGIAVDRADARTYPTGDVCTDAPDEYYYDEFQRAEIYCGEPVVILHQTADGEWLFVVCERFYGWVPATSVGVCSDRGEWIDWQDCDSFLTVTAAHLRLDPTPYDPSLAEKDLPMGTRIRLASDQADEIAGRAGYYCYTVELPKREADGSFAVGRAYLPISSDVTVGSAAYTKSNLLELAFKQTGSLYGNGGLFGNNDCSGFIMQIYRCFGFELPRNSRQLASIPGHSTDTSAMTGDEKLALLDSLGPGAMIFFPGHIAFYLGSEGGRQYVISSLHSFVPADTTDGGIVQTLSVAVTTLDVQRADGSTWLDNVGYVCTIGK